MVRAAALIIGAFLILCGLIIIVATDILPCPAVRTSFPANLPLCGQEAGGLSFGAVVLILGVAVLALRGSGVRGTRRSDHGSHRRIAKAVQPMFDSARMEVISR
jgi:hypothetical protein